jgi:hypothetical protein
MAKADINPRSFLQIYVREFPSQAAAARAMGISRSYLNHILAGRKSFSESILDKIGLKRVLVKS